MKTVQVPEVGMIVTSKMGRDKGHTFAIIKVVSAEFVFVADGKYRTLQNPKLKRVKHLIDSSLKLDNIATKLTKGAKVFDSELCSAITNSIDVSSSEDNK